MLNKKISSVSDLDQVRADAAAAKAQRIRYKEVLVCAGGGCIASGSLKIKQKLQEKIKEAGLSVDVVETGCLGPCAKGPVMVINPGRVFYENVSLDDVDEIFSSHIQNGQAVERLLHRNAGNEQPVVKMDDVDFFKKQTKVVLRNCGVIDPHEIEDYIRVDGYQALAKVLKTMSEEQVINEVKQSGLRGRGGAGFLTGLKWELTRKAQGELKYAICNADEGEPGTFKDRLILEGDPHKLIEGMMIAGYAVGATKGFVYIRGEYALSIERLEKAIAQARQYGILGDNILESGFSFDVEVMKGAGAYVCGEETALIESLEGKRGHPRNKPPYPVTEGLWGKPTVVNNVETLANVPEIIRNGAAWYRGYGTDKCPGTKVYTIIGNVATPGLIEAEMGTTLRDIIYEYAGGIKDGKKFKGALVGGAAGAFMGPEMLDAQMDFVNLREYAAVLGSGAILVMDDSADIVGMLKSVLHFFKHESCGHCVPCRLGTSQLVKIIDKIADGKGKNGDIEKLVKVSEVMRDTSFCPLGQSPILPISSSLKFFKDEIFGRVTG